MSNQKIVADLTNLTVQEFKAPRLQCDSSEDSGKCPRCNIRVAAEDMQDHNKKCLEIVGNRLHDCAYPDCGKRFVETFQ